MLTALLLMAAGINSAASTCKPYDQRSARDKTEKLGVTTLDYPEVSRVVNETGDVTYEVDVDAGGCPTACRVIKSSGHFRLDDRTCELIMQRGRFIPAVDSSGNRVASLRKGMFGWRPFH